MASRQSGRVAAIYSKLETKREPFLERGRECSELTIPALLPREGHNDSSALPTPYQSVGARGVNNLSSKMLLGTLPANMSFFRYTIDDFTLQEMTGKEGMRAEVEEALGQIERAVMNEVNSSGNNYRVHVHEALKLLVVSGNALLYLPKEGGSRVFRLDRYVVRRDPSGNVLEIITVEYLTRDTLPEEIIDQMDHKEDQPSDTVTEIPLYTRIYRSKSRRGNPVWKVEQEVQGIDIEASRGTYPIEDSPWIPLRWTKIDNESYGRGYTEEYLGDLKSLEALSRAIVEAAAIGSKVVFLKRPNSTTSTRKLARAENGDVIDGDVSDVGVLQVDKYMDLRTAMEVARQMTERLSYAYLIASQAVRQAERVTAEEIRFVASEIDSALGGTHSVLAQEFQLPFVKIIIKNLTDSNRIPALPKGVAQPVIVTGIEALGRGQDISSLRAAAEDLALLKSLPPEISQRINIEDLVTRIFTARGIDARGLVKDQDTVDAEQAQAQAMQLAERLGPEAMRQGGQMIEYASNQPQEAVNG